jgi:hypothetical protein
MDDVDDGIFRGQCADDYLEKWRHFLGQSRKHMLAYQRELAYAQQQLRVIIERRKASLGQLHMLPVSHFEVANTLLSGFASLEDRASQLHRRTEASYSAMMASLSISEVATLFPCVIFI